MGNNRIISNPDRHYERVHQWIAYYYGKANKCESWFCNGKSKNYHWALRKGFNYEKKIENFIPLCVSCHRKYDFTPQQWWKIKDSRNRKAIVQYSKAGEFIREFPSITLAAKTLNINKGNLQTCLKGKMFTSGGFKWKFKNAS